MTEDHQEKAIRLLDIIDGVVSQDDSYPEPNLPFSVNGDGSVVFDAKVSAELAKPENADLIDWAHKNVLSLFEWGVRQVKHLIFVLMISTLSGLQYIY